MSHASLFLRYLLLGQSVCTIKGPHLEGCLSIHTGSVLNNEDKNGEPPAHSGKITTADGSDGSKMKRKKLKGKRAVVRWLKFFRWKKKKEYERMTAEEKILYKLKKVNFVFKKKYST